MTHTASFFQALMAENSEITPLVLLTLWHPDMAEPARYVKDTHDVWSRGDRYMAAFFREKLPADIADELVTVELVVDNVDREIVATIRGLDAPPEVTLEVVTDLDPDTPEMGPFEFELKKAEYDTLEVRGQLAYEDILQEPFPAGTYNPVDFPALFQ